MTRVTIAGGAFATMFVVLALADGHWARERDVAAAAISSMTPAPADVPGDFLYGRVTTDDDVIYEGRLRFGGDEEAFWGHYFNGVKDQNRWAAHVPRERLPKMRDSFDIFGIEIFAWERQIDLGRPFMARLGDIARIEAHWRDLRVVLKSGTRFDLQRFAADDFADGVRVWDGTRGVVDLDEWPIRTIEFLPTARQSVVLDRLHGTVRTRNGDFTGFLQWNRKESVGSDELEGRTAEGALSLRFDTIRSIAPRLEARGAQHANVVLQSGEALRLERAGDLGEGNGGILVFVDGRERPEYVPWIDVEQVDFEGPPKMAASPTAAAGTERPRIVVVQHWLEEVKRLLPSS